MKEENILKQILICIETHDVEGIKACFQAGLSPNVLYKEKPLIEELTSNYLRSSRFKSCVQQFVDNGLQYHDDVLLTILLDDGTTLRNTLIENGDVIHQKITMRSAFTPIYDASLLHVCAEFGSLTCAKMLLENGMDANSKAGLDAFGFGGQTPIFHTVNQHQNFGLPMLELLLEYGADPIQSIKGLIWGQGYEWETFIPSVNPISYAMMGLLRQFQRTEKDIYHVVNVLMQHAYGIDYDPVNIPNKYLYSNT